MSDRPDQLAYSQAHRGMVVAMDVVPLSPPPSAPPPPDEAVVDERLPGHDLPERPTAAFVEGEENHDVGSYRRFVVWLLGCLFLMAGSILAINWWLDPTGVTGRSTRFATVENLEVRQLKLDIMDRAQQAPDVLVLGSSRSMMIDPQTIERQTGQRALNAAVSGANTQDAYLYAAYAAERWPDDYPHLLVGLVNDVFREPIAGSPLDERVRGLLGEEQEVDVLPMLGQLLQLKTTRASILAARREVEAHGPNVLLDPIGVPTPTGQGVMGDDGVVRRADQRENYRDDGMQLFDPHIDLRRPLRGRVQHQMQQYLASSFAEGDEFDGVSEGLRSFVDMVRLANAHGDVPAIFITPFHPQAADMLPAEYHERERRMRATLRSLQARGLEFTFHEYDDIAHFAGDPSEFYDGIHMTKTNTDRLVTLLGRDGALRPGTRDSDVPIDDPSFGRASQLANEGTVAPGR